MWCVGGWGGYGCLLSPGTDAQPLKETCTQMTTICTPFGEARPHTLTCLVLLEPLAHLYRGAHKGSPPLRDLPQPSQLLQNSGESQSRGRSQRIPTLHRACRFQPPALCMCHPPDRYACHVPPYCIHRPAQVSPRMSRRGGFRGCFLLRPFQLRLTA